MEKINKIDLVLSNRNALLKAITHNHKVEDVSAAKDEIIKFLQKNFPDKPIGLVTLAMQMSTDSLIMSMIEDTDEELKN